MKIDGGKITEATEDELFSLYLDREMDDIMDFREYKARMEWAGCRIIQSESREGPEELSSGPV